MLRIIQAGLPIFFLGVVAACNQPSSSSQPENVNPDAVIFRFSTAAMVEALSQGESNWCRRPFSEATMVAPDPSNTNRRLFMMGNGVYKVLVRQGSAAGALLLRKAGEKEIEVFTGENFPECLYAKTNCALTNNRSTLVYDNRKKIRYTLKAQPATGGLQVAITFDSNSNYGLTVHPCKDCR